ncbi:MarR family winged helix-turn-helix transcriptional regulator [Agromyces aurantiacus]|uniref:MarR family winged helix-turn-helix transcriptional regulator n=1 Tax=Agromyces aurantiacus TaxID=165814 RepID=A0ABV9R1P9_9MICO|nr:MarR family transcriptional regulator [Agromyces aurantiacus]MBM7502696.1 DNA-binding MarR family transcriptional regulator [Agromyces aurantiacus]
MSLLALLDRASQVTGAVVDFVLKEHGVTRAELAVLEVVAGGDALPSELAERAGVTRAGMTKRLDRLERAGLVERIPSPTDRRSVLVRATAAGRSMLPSAVAARDRVEAQLLARLAPGDQAHLGDILRRLLAEGD